MPLFCQIVSAKSRGKKPIWINLIRLHKPNCSNKAMKDEEPMNLSVDQEALNQIHETAVRVLVEIGIKTDHLGIRQRLADRGCRVKGENVLIPPDLIDQTLRKIPSSFKVFGRHLEEFITIGSGTTYGINTGIFPNIYDFNNGEIRRSTLKDVQDTTRLMDAMENLHAIFVSLVDATDLAPHMVTASNFATALANTTKPLIGPGVTNRAEAEAIIKIARVMREGDSEQLKRFPVCVPFVCPISPLFFPRDIVDALVCVAESGLPLIALTNPIMGLTSPYTIASTVCLGHAEVLATAVIAHTITLATAGLHNGQLADINHQQYPRVDYIEMQRLVDMDVLDYATYDHNRFGKHLRYAETKLRSDLYLTFIGLLSSKEYGLTFAMSERAGIPYSGLHRLLPNRPPLVSMFQRWSWRQERFVESLNLSKAMDSIIVHCNTMKEHLITLGASPEQIHVINYGVDQQFFTPNKEISLKPGFVLSLGEPSTRDYQTLIDAVDGLPLELFIAASGHWYAREKDSLMAGVLPENVTVSGGIPVNDLRNIYAQAQFVALPVQEAIHSAGSTAILESMCMGKAVVVTRSPGICDYVIDGVTGILVEPGDIQAWREAIQYLIAHPEEARRMGQNGRQRAEEELNLDIYINKIAELLNSYL
jgi:glycosyltransferase involved in cell wall biosynthesis